MRWIAIILWVLCSTGALASEDCFTLVELSSGKTLKKMGACDQPASPCSTFKIPLSLMGFDSRILSDSKTPEWPYKQEYDESRDICKTPHNPTTWLQDSCIWYSRVLTQNLGMSRFQNYVNKFDYGNKDLSGDPGKDNGLTHAWLSSSLKIAPSQQITFLSKLLKGELQISPQAAAATRTILFSQELSQGWKLFGKTGTGNQLNADGSSNQDRQIGWFVGWITKGSRTLVFSQLLREDQKQVGPAGKRAKVQAIRALEENLSRILKNPN